MFNKIVSFLFLAAMLLSCTPQPDPVPQNRQPSSEKVVVTFAAPESSRFLYKSLIDTFNKQNNDIEVRFVPYEDAAQLPSQSNGLSEAFVLATLADTSIGVIQPSDIINSYVADLKPYIESDMGFDLTDYFPQSLIPMSSDGGIYVLPHSTYTPLLYYNKQLLPDLPNAMDWHKLLEIAGQAVRKSSKIDVYGLMDGEEGLLAFLHFVDEAQGDVFSIPPDQVNFQQEAFVKAAQRTRELVANGTIYSLQTSDSAEQAPNSIQDVERLVRTERLAIWRAGAFSLDIANSDLGFEVGTINMPLLRQMTFVPFRYGFLMSSGTPHPNAAWRWLSFLSRQSTPIPHDRFNVPARRSIADTGQYWSTVAAQDAVLMKHFLEQPVAQPTVFANGEARTALLSQWGSIVAGTDSVESGLDRAQAQLDSLLQQLREAQTNATTAEVAVRLPEEIPVGVQVIDFGMTFDARVDLRELAKIFEEQNTTLRVKVRYPGNADALDSLNVYAQAYDCFAWHRPPTEQEAAFLLDVAPIVDATTTFDASDYPLGVLAPFKIGVKQFGVPYSIKLNVLAYNQVLFDQLGVATPALDWSLNDFLSTAQQLTDMTASSPHYGYGMTFSGPVDLRVFLAIHGAANSSNANGVIEPNFTNEAFVRAAQFYVDLLKNTSSYQSLPGYREPHFVPDVLTDGRTAMWITPFADAFAPGGTTDVLDPKITALPKGTQGAAATNMLVSGLYISGSSQNTQACWDWIQFLSTRLDAINRADFPARSSLAQSEDFLSQALPGAEAVYQAYQPVLEQPTTDTLPDIFTDPQFDPFWLYRAIDRAMQGGNLEQELQNAEMLTRQYYDCIREGRKPYPCARSVDARYEGFATR
jgi:ABC-type glycerol-3-phosphate transport system substrate-binding protein